MEFKLVLERDLFKLRSDGGCPANRAVGIYLCPVGDACLTEVMVAVKNLQFLDVLVANRAVVFELLKF
jgi:hypothetical protein